MSTSRWRVVGSAAFPLARAASRTSSHSFTNMRFWPSVDAPRSNPRVPIATRHPPSTSPTMLSASVVAPVKKTSLNSESPVTWWIGRISTPSCRMGTRRYEMPLCLAASRLVRASTKHQSAQWACEVHTFCPSIDHRPSTSSARVCTLARSEPAPGSL